MPAGTFSHRIVTSVPSRTSLKRQLIVIVPAKAGSSETKPTSQTMRSP
eukprot:gene12114-15428_t